MPESPNKAIPDPSKATDPKQPGKEPVRLYDLENQYFKGPGKGQGAYASVCVLDPVITLERHHGKFHIAARFNIETTILRYNTQKGYVFHERPYFHELWLIRYLSAPITNGSSKTSVSAI